MPLKPLLFLSFYHHDPGKAESMLQRCLLCGASYSLFPHPPRPVRNLIEAYRPLVEKLYGRRWLLEPDPLDLPGGVDGNIFVGENGNPLISIDVLQELTALYYLHLSDTGLGDLDPLSGLTVLHTLFIVDNHVDDLAPLVANEGLGTGDVIHAGGNPIDCVNQAEHIATLKARGVTVNTDCP